MKQMIRNLRQENVTLLMTIQKQILRKEIKLPIIQKF